MSRGPGRIQRAVAAIFAAEPDNAFLTIELCERVYGLDRYCEGRIDNRFRIALMRAAKKVPGVEWQECSRLGGELVFFNAYSVMSRGMADQKSNYGSNFYRNRDRRIWWS